MLQRLTTPRIKLYPPTTNQKNQRVHQKALHEWKNLKKQTKSKKTKKTNKRTRDPTSPTKNDQNKKMKEHTNQIPVL